MPGPLEMAALSDLLPGASAAPRVVRVRRLLPARLARSRRPQGLERIPERYRLQLLLLASDRMPGRPAGDVAVLAGRLADLIDIPARLLARLPRTDELDAWFREHREDIAAALDGLAVS